MTVRIDDLGVSVALDFFCHKRIRRAYRARGQQVSVDVFAEEILMKTVIGFLSLCLVLIALTPVQAQNFDTFARLREVASAHYSVEEKREGDFVWLDWVASYRPPGTREIYDWRLQANVVGKPGQTDIVRLWFSCGEMPAKPNADRMLKMLEWNGSHASSGAYFKSGPGSNGVQLSIIVDVPVNDLVDGKFEKAVEHLLEFAYDTISIWDEPGKPLRSAESEQVTLESIAGQWSGVATQYEMEGQWSEEVGEWSAKIESDGFIVLSRVNTKDANPKVEVKTGIARIEGKELIIKYPAGTNQSEEVYHLSFRRDTLTLHICTSKVYALKIVLNKRS